MFVKNLVFES